MDIGVSYSQENVVLEVEDDVINPSPSSNVESSWVLWTQEDLKTISEHLHYHTESIEFLNKCWTSGLTNDKPPERPKSDIKDLVMEGRKRKASLELSKRLPKVKTNSYKEMNDEEFNTYLLNLVCDTEQSVTAKDLISTDLVSVGEYLRSLHEKVRQSNIASLHDHLQLGNGLIRSKEIFDHKKTIKTSNKKGITETWITWVSKNTEISESQERRLRQVARLVRRFPKLESLSVTFSELYNMTKKIEEVFIGNIMIYEQWGGKQ